MKFLNLHKNEFIALSLALGLSFVLYGNSIKGDFVSDDKLVIVQNPFVSGNFSDFFKAFSAPYYYNQPHAGLYRPLTTASYNLNKVFSSESFGFHLINVLLSAFNGFLVFLLASRFTSQRVTLGFTGKRSAFLAMILFLLLPIHSEAVSAIVGRAELLALFFSVLYMI